MKIFNIRDSITNLLVKTGHAPRAEFFPHAVIATLCTKISGKIIFIPDEKHVCEDGEELYIDIAFTLENPADNILTTVIVEMKYKRTADIAVKEAIFYRKVFDDIAKIQKRKFDRFIYIGINVPER